MKIIDYMIILSTDAARLACEVKLAMTDGWQPQGGVCSDSEFGRRLYQVMVKYEEIKL